MKLITGSADFKEIKADSLVKFCFEDGHKNDNNLKALDKILGGTIKKLYTSGEFSGKLNQTLVLYTSAWLPAERIILVGLGEKKKVKNDNYRQAAGTVSRLTPVKKSKTVAFHFSLSDSESVIEAAVEGFLLGRFDMDDYKTGTENKNNITEIAYFYGASKAQSACLNKAVSRAEIIADAVTLARRLAMHPGNIITPKSFAAEALSLSRKYHFKCTVLDEKMIREEKMGALAAVGQGSEQPPRFVILQYRSAKASPKPIVLIGKGITFDSGGISLKPGLEMDEMKGDMTGGAIMMATLMTAVRLKLPLNLVALIPLAENMPSGKALKPGDIITSRKGKTIEIINTDAEGRLILADALDYANKFKPQAVIDIATLTGAAIFVLGNAGVPILGNNRKLMENIKAASEATAEKVWELPLWDDYREMMKSSIADLKNSGGRPAGTITATAFLENFIGDWPWAHIDIASVDLEKSGKPYIPKGATGIGVRLLVELLARWKKV